MGELLLSSTCCWTGSVAAWAPFPAQPQQQAGNGLPPLKTSSCGVWLRSDASGVLIVQWRADAHPLLACTLRRNVELVRAPLLPGSFAFKLLCPQHGSGGEGDAGSCGHLLFMTLAVPGMAGSIQQTRSFAVHFDTEQAGRECGALLQAIQSGSLRAVKPQLVPAQHGGDQGSNNAVCGQAWGQQAEGRPSQVWVTKTGKRVQSKTKEADEMLFGYADKKSLMAAVQATLADPEFHRYEQQLEKAVEAVEAVLAQEVAGLSLEQQVMKQTQA